MLLDEVLKAALFKVFSHIVLHVKNDLGTTGKLFTFIRNNSEGATSVGFPSVLLVIVVLGNDYDSLGNEVS